MNRIPLNVTCYSGHTYAEEPRSFVWEGVEQQVKDIEKSWVEPGQRCFRVRADCNKLFQLCYNVAQDQWWGIEVQNSKSKV
ncbi:MAG: hypothetical protein HYX79_03590 [Chloroflexi bacterium]|nr:hypothetical protein [Chloroflexota bacterium]